jgi:hypothetical protein
MATSILGSITALTSEHISVFNSILQVRVPSFYILSLAIVALWEYDLAKAQATCAFNPADAFIVEQSGHV